MAIFIDPFDVLLMEISHDLNQDNLRSLKHVCRYYITESQRETIKHGLDVFEILRKREVVTAERDKIGNLLKIMKAMRPNRKDLIRKVETYIKKNYADVPDTLLIIDCTNPELEASTSSEDGIKLTAGDQDHDNRSANVTLLSRPRCCSADFCCCACNCYSRRISACFYGFLAMLVTFLAIFAVLAWYADVPRVHPYLTNDPDRKIAGKYVVVFLGLIALVFFILCFRARRDHSQLGSYSVVRPAAAQPDYGSIKGMESGAYIQESMDSLPRINGMESGAYIQESMDSLPRINGMESGAYIQESMDSLPRINGMESGAYIQESMDSLPRKQSVAKNINKQRKIFQAASGCSTNSRVSSRSSALTSPPSLDSQAITEQSYNHCTSGSSGCHSCYGYPPVPGTKARPTQRRSMDGTASQARLQGLHGPKYMLMHEDQVTSAGSRRVGGQELDSDVETDTSSQIPGAGHINNEFLGHSFSSGSLFSSGNAEDVTPLTAETQ